MDEAALKIQQEWKRKQARKKEKEAKEKESKEKPADDKNPKAEEKAYDRDAEKN